MIKYQKEINSILKKQHCLYDDVCFAAAANENPEIIEDIVKRVFSKTGINIKSISRSEVQKRLFSPESRDVIFDCYAETEDGVRMAVEVQNDPSRFSHIREGFYLSKLRVMEDKGKDYDDMLPVYLIILHRHNPYRKQGFNLPLYEKGCYIKDTGMKYSDGMNVLRVNGDYMEEGDMLGDLLAAMRATEIEEIKISPYREAMKNIKEKFGMEYTFKDLLQKSWDDGVVEGEIKGEAKGEAKGRIQARNEMLDVFRKLGVPEDIISKAAEAGSQSV